MSAAQYNIVIDIGSDFYLKVSHKNPDGTAVNLTGCSAIARLRETYDSAIALADFNISINQEHGTVEFRLPKAITDTLIRTKRNNYVWDYKLTDALGYISAKLFGNVMVRGDASAEDVT